MSRQRRAARDEGSGHGLGGRARRAPVPWGDVLIAVSLGIPVAELARLPARRLRELRQAKFAELIKHRGAPTAPTSAVASRAVDAPLGDAPDLSPRQRETLACLLAGDGEKQIARKLTISPHTVHIHVKQIYRRFGVTSRGELLSRFIRSRREGAACGRDGT